MAKEMDRAELYGSPDNLDPGCVETRLMVPPLLNVVRGKPGFIGKCAQGLQCILRQLYEGPSIVYVTPIDDRTPKSFQIELENRDLVGTLLRIAGPLKIEDALAVIESPFDGSSQTATRPRLLNIDAWRFRPRLNKRVFSVGIVLYESRNSLRNSAAYRIDLIA